MKLHSRHLLGLEGVSKEDLTLILDTAVSFKEVLERPIKKVPPLQGKTIVNLFFESSTRTRISFELAERRLSADVVSFASSGSSVSKGETLKDTPGSAGSKILLAAIIGIDENRMEVLCQPAPRPPSGRSRARSRPLPWG